MRIIAFITHSAAIRHILNHIWGGRRAAAHYTSTRAAAVALVSKWLQSAYTSDAA
jgi:hypothetical protein